MFTNISPWFDEIKTRRYFKTLNENIESPIVIVGGGLAGLATLYYILKFTSYRVTLLEGDSICSGASGFGGGHLLTSTEKSLESIVGEYGEDMSFQDIRHLENAWLLLEDMYSTVKGRTPIFRETAWVGISDIPDIIEDLKYIDIRNKMGLPAWQVYISNDVNPALIPEEYHRIVTPLPHSQITSLLNIKNKNYIYCRTSDNKGTLNIPMFCYELIEYLLFHYKERFQIYENSYVEEIIFESDHIDVYTEDKKVRTEKVILCTNGYTNFDIYDRSKDELITKLKENVGGVVGAMAGYLNTSKDKFSSVLFNRTQENPDVPYFYMSQHPFITREPTKTLTTLGGPEKVLEEEEVYIPEKKYVTDATEQFDRFIDENYYVYHNGFDYEWQGLMAYTTNMLRWIGPDPEYQNLFYNLGCNGIGVLPSVYGAYKVAKILEGVKFPKSIFDPLT